MRRNGPFPSGGTRVRSGRKPSWRSSEPQPLGLQRRCQRNARREKLELRQAPAPLHRNAARSSLGLADGLDETTSSVFPADLFIEPGEQPAVTREDLSEAMLSLYRGSGIFAHEEPVRRVVRRLQELAPVWVHPMHGGSLTSDISPRFYQALLNESFAYTGLILGRQLAS